MKPMCHKLRKVVGVANIPEFQKFRVYLECGHSILYDHTVDAVSEYTVPNLELFCYECTETDEGDS